MSWYCWLGTGLIVGAIGWAAFNKSAQQAYMRAQ